MTAKEHRRFESVAQLSALVILAAQAWVLELVVPLAPVKVVGLILASLGLYVLLFRLLLFVYKRVAWKLVQRQGMIQGRWHILIKKAQGSPATLHGVAIIDQELDDVVISARHYKDAERTLLWSTWQSESVWFDGRSLLLYWSVSVVDGRSGRGGMSLKTDGCAPPKVIEGSFFDLEPLKTSGSVRFTRVGK